MPKKVDKQLNEVDNRLAQLEDENLHWKIENEVLKLFASIQQRDSKSQKSFTDSRHNSN